MISENNAHAFCCEDISKIENYEQAITDQTQSWVCHHKAEVLPCGNFTVDTLIKFKLYWHRPANELIFMKRNEHAHLHRKNLPIETKHNISNAMRRRKLSNKTKQKIRKSLKQYFSNPANREKISNSLKGKHCSASSNVKRRRAMQKKHWYNNGVKTIRAEVCPIGFVAGRLKQSHL